ncbi:MAG: nucleotidyl transferase AbiEii/AbiGii toxin family protein [Candidatus Magasanikbacteria bacterium]|nr:nucleotidyl transferase AbiEii/AbiGii toxin family protein [Candidatus Magasanikbacteria bacterium]
MLNQSKHRSILLSILKDIYSDSEISPQIGFKGGTAAFLFYDLTRFSMDLDFDLLDKNFEHAVFEKVKKIAGKYGQIKDAQKKFFTLFFVVSYGKEDRNVKVEISRRTKDSRYEIKQFLGIPMLVMIQKDMCTNKLLAMSEQMNRLSRDIYDVWFFLSKMWPINKGIVEDRSKKKLPNFLLDLANQLDKLPENQILEGMGELLDEKQKLWVKNSLKKETIFQLRLRAHVEE